ncbi:hypothetical protein [Methylobacterium oryzae]|uniref:Uncharacterized protein n=1 Tax=Methylobacterium oryzae TaxID=334852 RepID=A0ABU7TUD9_9HYPH
MAVYFYTARPAALLDEFNARLIHRDEWKRIYTWAKSEDGTAFTHVADGWVDKAWLKPRIDSDKLAFNIFKPIDSPASAAVYSYYHGEIVEAFLRQLDLMFELVSSTPRCADGDIWA